jgi:3-oxoacyl-[acyl-carrier protein] reductase
MLFDLHGRRAIVTGAGQNVGAGIAIALAEHGAFVGVNDLHLERAQRTVDDIVARGGSATPVAFDVTDRAATDRAIHDFAPVDILVNNAGIPEGAMPVEPFAEMDPEKWDAPIRVNVFGVMNCCHAVVRGMTERGFGRIITISSGAGTRGVNIGVSPYSAGKGGGIAFTRTLALEVARRGVTANTLALGLIGMSDSAINEKLGRTIPVGRTGTPLDVAAACVWLASDEAAWVTAQTIELNGGALTT